MSVSMFKILSGMYATKIPTMIYSNPGMGKSSIIKMLGSIMSVPTILKSANKLTDVELMGVPYIADVKVGSTEANGDVEKFTKDLKYSLPKYIKELNKNPNGVLFFDELPTAPQSIQTMLLQIIQDCNFNEFTIPKTTFRCAAGNYSDVGGNSQITIALSNRMANFHWNIADYDIDELCDGLESGWTNYQFAKVNDSKTVENKKIKYARLVSKFWRSHNDMINNMPKSIIVPTDVSYPTQRSWENVIIALAYLDQNDDDYVQCIVDALIGPSAGTLFMKYVKSEKVFEFDVSKYLGKEDTLLLPNPDRHDEAAYIMRSIMYLMSNSKDPQKYKKLFIRAINLMINEDNKFGHGYSYKNIAMQYFNSGYLLLSKDIKSDDNEAWSKLIKEFIGKDGISNYNDIAIGSRIIQES